MCILHVQHQRGHGSFPGFLRTQLEDRRWPERLACWTRGQMSVNGENVKRASHLIVLMAVLSCSLFADQIVLKNGDRLTGTIVKSDGKTLVLHTDAEDDVT